MGPRESRLFPGRPALASGAIFFVCYAVGPTLHDPYATVPKDGSALLKSKKLSLVAALPNQVVVSKKVKPPEQLTTSPLSLACPLCHAQPDQPCELFRDEIELVHVERIQWAAALDRITR
jgi:hypothetical protein